MKNDSNNSYSILSIIQIVLVILKLFNLIDWSWWLVCIPIYISIGLSLFYIIIALIYEKMKGK